MRTALLSLLGTFTLIASSQAQEPVLIAGGSTPPTPIVVGQPVPTAPAVPVVYVPVAVAPVAMMPVAYAPPVQIVSGGYYNPPNVIYFGGPNSCYNAGYGYGYGYGSPGCSYSPSVIYFGRGEACQRGYAFRHPR